MEVAFGGRGLKRVGDYNYIKYLSLLKSYIKNTAEIRIWFTKLTTLEKEG
jgi:hypothetical protein